MLLDNEETQDPTDAPVPEAPQDDAANTGEATPEAGFRYRNLGAQFRRYNGKMVERGQEFVADEKEHARFQRRGTTLVEYLGPTEEEDEAPPVTDPDPVDPPERAPKRPPKRQGKGKK